MAMRSCYYFSIAYTVTIQYGEVNILNVNNKHSSIIDVNNYLVDSH